MNVRSGLGKTLGLVLLGLLLAGCGNGNGEEAPPEIPDEPIVEDKIKTPAPIEEALIETKQDASVLWRKSKRKLRMQMSQMTLKPQSWMKGLRTIASLRETQIQNELENQMFGLI